MSSLIEQAQPPAVRGVSATQRTGAGSAVGTGESQAAAPVAPVALQTTPSTPPPEVLAQMQHAAETWSSLQAEGYEVHFSQDPQSQRSVVELRNAQGVTVRRLTPSEALALATGEGPPAG